MAADPNRSPATTTNDPARPSRRVSTYVITVVAVLIVAATAWYAFTPRTPEPTAATKGGFGAGGGRRGGGDPAARGPLPGASAPVRVQQFPLYLNALGNVTARNTVTVRPRVEGQLARVLFKEGQLVKAGDLLAEIDPRPFEVQVTQANGQLARDQAQLTNARLDLERYQTLLKQDSIAKQQVDTQEALVRQYQGTIEADRGAVENAKLQLSYTKITAPVGGRLGLRQVDVGNIVRASDTNGLVVITQVQPISVVYSIPEDRLSAVRRRLQEDAQMPVDAYDRDGKVKLASGRLVTIDNQIDPATGTIKLKAEFANDDGALFPNQFVNVRMHVDTLQDATVVPTPAVQRGTPGTFVYRVNDNDTVSVQAVKLGPVDGETTVIAEGVKGGDRVVVDGTDKLRDGAAIEPIDRSAAAASAQAPPTNARGPGAGRGGRRRGDGQGGAAPTADTQPNTPSASTPAQANPPSESTPEQATAPSERPPVPATAPSARLTAPATAPSAATATTPPR
jgi:multidrug efflux system membrane fusion protein